MVVSDPVGISFELNVVCKNCCLSKIGYVSKGSTKEKKNFCDDATNIQAVIVTYYNGATVGNTAFFVGQSWVAEH